MPELVLHEITAKSVDRFVRRPAHALAIVGPPGSGKLSVAHYIARKVLDVDEQAYSTYPHLKLMEPAEEKTISIDAIRELQSFMTLKVPGKKSVARLVIIRDAHLMTVEAQNALLKLLEEPPADSVLLLTVAHMDALLATIRSRVRLLRMVTPPVEVLKQFHIGQGSGPAAIDRALMLSGGLPGLTQALLNSEESHPLYEATEIARGLLQKKPFERLATVDTMSKQKQQAQEVLFILGQMARIALARTKTESADTQRWKQILASSYKASEQLRGNAQPKLVLTHLMLEL